MVTPLVLRSEPVGRPPSSRCNPMQWNTMRSTPLRAARAALVAVVGVVAWSGAAGAQQPSASARLTPAQIEAIYRARTDSARMHFTKADVDFMTGMIMHHGQALIMAGMAPTHGANSAVQTLCARIINAQKDEIVTMQQWLRDRQQPVPQVEINGLGVALRFPGDSSSMAGMSMGPAPAAQAVPQAHAAHEMPMGAAKSGAGKDMQMSGDMRAGGMAMMPGMLTPEQMAQLDQARGADFDRLFLTGMIQHHNGAISMVHDLFGTAGAGEDELSFKLASDIRVDQATEIARMQKMLAALSLSASH